MLYANSKCQDQHVHPRSPIKVVSVGRYCLQSPKVLTADNKDLDLTASVYVGLANRTRSLSIFSYTVDSCYLKH